MFVKSINYSYVMLLEMLKLFKVWWIPCSPNIRTIIKTVFVLGVNRHFRLWLLRSPFCLFHCAHMKGQAVSNPMVPGATAYWVPRVPSPIPPSSKQPMTSSEEDPDERSNAGDQGTDKMFHTRWADSYPHDQLSISGVLKVGSMNTYRVYDP